MSIKMPLGMGESSAHSHLHTKSARLLCWYNCCEWVCVCVFQKSAKKRREREREKKHVLFFLSLCTSFRFVCLLAVGFVFLIQRHGSVSKTFEMLNLSIFFPFFSYKEKGNTDARSFKLRLEIKKKNQHTQTHTHTHKHTHLQQSRYYKSLLFSLHRPVFVLGKH